MLTFGSADVTLLVKKIKLLLEGQRGINLEKFRCSIEDCASPGCGKNAAVYVKCIVGFVEKSI